MNDTDWMPTASLAHLTQRAAILARIRAFFAAAHVLEVDTPLLMRSVIADPHLQLMTCHHDKHTLYLQPSPEAAMKRLLAAGSGSIYQICKAFRQEEQGRLHNPEFTLLEWYRVGFDHHALMHEVDALLQAVLACPPATRLSYAQVFQQYLAINPHDSTLTQLRQLIKQQQIPLECIDDLDKDACLDLLMTHCVEPHLGQQQPLFIYDYPVSQAALAQTRQQGNVRVGERFEVYYRGVELANGYHELADAKEQRQRFIATNQWRVKLGASPVTIDEHLLAALAHGLPDCAGVALGIDRLVLLATQGHAISDVMSFAQHSV